MRKIFFSFLVSIFLSTNIFAYEETFDDLNKTAQEILEEAYKMFEKSKEIIESFTKTDQKVLPESKNSFLLYHKRVKNSLPVEKRNDFLISTQIKYKISLEKDIPLRDILIISKDGVVELFGKVDSKDKAEKIIDIALKTRGVKEVVSYLIIIEPAILEL